MISSQQWNPTPCFRNLSFLKITQGISPTGINIKNAYPEPLESHRNSKRCAKYLRKMENEQRWRELSGIQALLPHTTTESTAVLSSISMNTTSSILPLARTSSRIVSPHLHSARSQAFNDEPEQIELHMFEESEQQMSEEVEQQTFEAVGQQTSEEIEL